jgi:hypothetical protein
MAFDAIFDPCRHRSTPRPGNAAGIAWLQKAFAAQGGEIDSAVILAFVDEHAH